MSTKTSNYNLIKPSPEDFYNIEDQNKNMDVIDEKLHEVEGKVNNVDEELKRHIEDYERLSDTISSGAIHTTSLNLGMNRIHIPEVSVSPTIEFEGFSYVNLLGKDGNCEDLSKWYTYQSILSLDTLNKVFGNNCIKVIAASNYLTLVNRTNLKSHIAGKKIFVSLYIKTNATEQIRVDIRNLGTEGGSAYNKAVNINSTPTMTRVGLKLDLSDSADYDLYLWIVKANPTAATEMYVDGVMVNVIADIEYNNLSVEDLLAKYPYVDSYACLTNPYFENRRYNLVRNGNCEEGIAYWYNNNPSTQTFSTENGKFKSVTTSPGKYVYQIVKVKKNTDYYIQANVSSEGTPGLYVFTSDISKKILAGGGVFNTAENTEIAILLHTGTTTGTFYFDSIILVEGTEPPTEYESCDLQRFVVEGQFASGDKVKIENGKVSGLLNWKHTPPLYGKDFDWRYRYDYTGYKTISMSTPVYFKNIRLPQSEKRHLMVNYSGDILPRYTNVYEGSNGFAFNDTEFFINIPNTESGWTSVPNADEVKAFMNGWKAVANNGTRYTLWVSKVDNNPPEKFSTTLASDTIVGQYTISVTDATKLKVGRKIVISGASLFVSTISSIDGNIVTLGNAMTMQIPSGTGVASSDDGTTDLSMLNFCKNNVAPGYEGYKLHYKLANPEPITDANVHIKGEIWDLVKGDNYVIVDSGIVLNEVPNIGYQAPNYWINSADPDYPSALSPLKYKVEAFSAVYKNNIWDNQNWQIGITELSYGRSRIFINESLFDSNAAYTVDYQILKTLHAQTFGSLSLSYKQGIISTLESHSKSLEQKQNKDCSLDTLIDLSVYEEFKTVTVLGRPAHLSYIGPMFYLDWSFTPKRVKPLVTFRNIDMAYYDSSGNRTPIELRHLQIGIMYLDRSHIRVYGYYIGKDSTIINALREYGGYLMFDLILDCRGRI